jgi:hypothetical protein
MKMRNFYSCVVLLACLATTYGSEPAARAETPLAGVQSLFAGDHLCGDNPTDCPFPATTALHRYLHIVLHDKPGDVDWGVWVGPDCASSVSEATGAMPVKASGYVEAVVDLQVGHAKTWEGTPLCFLFRGGYGQASTYYASYFDDSSQVDATKVYPEYERLGGRPDLADLDVTYIQRTPSYAYDASPNMPEPGKSVTYTAHVVNQGGRPLSSFRYHWLLDGKETGSGQSSSDLGTFDQMLVSVTLPWSTANHKLTFRAVASEQELSTENNSLSVDTDAITLGFWVEQSAYTYFRDYQQRYCAVQGCAGSDSLEDWLQRQVRAWNVLFRRASYAGLTPAGITTRVRVDKIVVVPDGALPLHGGIASDDPDKRDHSVDLQWGLPARDIAEAYSQSSSGPFRIDWALLHELGHARSLADLYRFDFPVDSPSRIAVVGADGRPVYDASDPFGIENKIRGFAGSDGGTLVYQNMERDLMSCVCSDFYSPYSALVLNRLGNRRALCGNFNPPCNIGDWYADIPPKNVIRVLNQSGRTPAGPVKVRLFYDSGGGYDLHQFTQQDSTALTGLENEFTLPTDPFRSGPSTDRIGHYLLLIEVTTSEIDQFCFQEPTDFNLAYWEGHSDASHPAVFTLRLGHTVQNACMLSLPAALVNEPFGTSTSASSVRLGPVTEGPKGKYRVATVQLVDAARIPMHMRRLVIRDQQGRTVAQATTDLHGGVSTRIPAPVSSISVDDVTDNHLMLASE